MMAVAGDEVNLKITTRIDLVLADRMLQMRTVGPTDDPASERVVRGAAVLVIGGTNGIGLGIADEATRARAHGRGRRPLARPRRPRLRGRASALEAAAARMGGIDHVIVTAGVLRIGRSRTPSRPTWPRSSTST